MQQAAHVFENAGVSERAERYAKIAIELATQQNLPEVAARAYSILYILKYDADDPLGSLHMLERLGECARQAASTRIALYGLIASYDLHAELGDESALDRLDGVLRENQASLPANRVESLLPALAFRSAWNGEFSRAYQLLASTIGMQNGPEREALRAAEVALYASAGGLQLEAEEAMQQAELRLQDSRSSNRRTIRARILLGLAEIVRGHSAHAHRLLSAAEQQLAPNMRRLRALASAARAAYKVQMEQAQPAALDDAVERLQREQLGGFARLLRRLPLGSLDHHAFGALTPAEREILSLLATGASTKEVANRTGRSPHTVDTHIRSMCRKLGCSGRREAVALATSQGWVQS
jgi:DNA-binding CsgD family transcriptional regulator